MLETHLVDPDTVVQSNGVGTAVEISAAAQTRVFLITVSVTGVVEQESLQVSIFGSADGQTWLQKPLMTAPQVFYPGSIPVLLDLSRTTDVRFLRAQWDVNRWGRGYLSPWFVFSVQLREVPREYLASAKRS